jgi:uncharacterized integral membrane protein
MGLDVGELINEFVDACLSKPYVRSISQNPIYTTLLIVIVMILIMVFTFRHEKTQESMWAISLRLGIYIFGAVLAVVFLHDKVLLMDMNNRGANSEVMQAFTPTDLVGNEENIIPVTLPTDFTL